jgi:Na+/melibiose symporter-like transporter
MLYGLVPPALAIIGALCFVGYSLTEARHAEIRSELDRLHPVATSDEDSGIMTSAGH